MNSIPKKYVELATVAKEVFELCSALEDLEMDLDDCGEMIKIDDKQAHIEKTNEVMGELAALLQQVQRVRKIAGGTEHPAIVSDEQADYEMIYGDDMPVDLLFGLDAVTERLAVTLYNAETAKQAQAYRNGISRTKVEDFNDSKREEIEKSLPLPGDVKYLHCENNGYVESKLHPDSLTPPLERIWCDYIEDQSFSKGCGGLHIDDLIAQLRLAGNFIAGLYMREMIEDASNTRESNDGKMTVREANIRVRGIMEREVKKGELALCALTIRKLAGEIGCSVGTIHKCGAYKALAEVKRSRGTKPSVKRLGESLLAVTGDSKTKRPDQIVADKEYLDQLIKQQQADQREDTLRKSKGIRPTL